MAVKDIVEGRESLGQAARNSGVSRCTVKDRLRKYDESGIEGLKDTHTWKRTNHPFEGWL
ncbi:helix-turn-helix domain containing protein [Sporolactobacillus terrae]|nr:helix-turn-helix domain containing protein [Sporolactobacillus terrae]